MERGGAGADGESRQRSSWREEEERLLERGGRGTARERRQMLCWGEESPELLEKKAEERLMRGGRGDAKRKLTLSIELAKGKFHHLSAWHCRPRRR